MRDFDVAVVGGGTAGITAALAARHAGERVALVEREPRLGGDCTFYSCVPSKALVEIAPLAYEVQRAAEDGILAAAPPLDFGAVTPRRDRAVDKIARDERDERFTADGIEIVAAERELRVEERRLRARDAS